MYEPRLNKTQALAAARWLIVDFHENLPAVDGTTEAVIIDQFSRELAAAVQHDVAIDYIVDMLETLDRSRSLYYRVDEYMGLDTDAVEVEEIHLSNVLTDDLNRAFSNYSPRALHYFTNPSTSQAA